MKNSSVVEAWYRGIEAKSGTMSTDGNDLFSYGMKIGRTINNDVKQALNVQSPNFYSQTTSCHVGLAKNACNEVVEPVRQQRGYSSWFVFPEVK